LAESLRAEGRVGPAIVRPLVNELNRQASISAAEKADAAHAAGAKQAEFTRGTWGVGPLARMPNGDFVVPSRAPFPKAPVIIIKSNGRVLVGKADLELVNNMSAMKISNVTE
jgi:hypothetical protein